MIYLLENENLKVEINDMGAEPWSLFDKTTKTEHIWHGDPKFWQRRSPVLFPICGALKDDTYIIDGKTYEMKLHGFAKDFAHEVVSEKADEIIFTFRSSQETLSIYPFNFQLNTKFFLKGNCLSYIFEVINTGENTMPFSIGFHTGFTIPFDKNEDISDYSLVFQKEETIDIILKSGQYMTMEKEPFLEGCDNIPISHDMFPSSIIMNGIKSEYIGVVNRKNGREVRVHAKGFPNTLIWSTPERVPYICIEPWHGLPDPVLVEGCSQTNHAQKQGSVLEDANRGDFFKKPEIVLLEPKKSFECEQIIEILR